MIRLAPLALALLALPIAAVVAHPGGAPSISDAALRQDDATPLQAAMETLKQGQRGLKKLLAEPAKNEAALTEWLGKMEAACLVAVAAKIEIPAEVAQERHPLLRVGYKRGIASLLQQVLAMEEATLKGDAAALQAAYDELGEIKKQGHEHYRDF